MNQRLGMDQGPGLGCLLYQLWTKDKTLQSTIFNSRVPEKKEQVGENWGEQAAVLCAVVEHTSKESFKDKSMKISISMSNRNMRETGSDSRLKTQGRNQSFDNEWSWIMVKSSKSKEKQLVSGITEKGSAQRKQPLVEQRTRKMVLAAPATNIWVGICWLNLPWPRIW